MMYCPVCKKENTDTRTESMFCTSCGYDFFYLSSNVPDEMKNYYDSRLKNYKDLYEKWKINDSKTIELQNDLNQLESNFEKLKKEKEKESKRKEELIKEKEIVCEKHEELIKEKEKDREKQKELDSQLIQLQAEKNKAVSLNRNYEKKIETISAENKNLKQAQKDISNLEKKVHVLSETLNRIDPDALKHVLDSFNKEVKEVK